MSIEDIFLYVVIYGFVAPAAVFVWGALALLIYTTWKEMK